MRAFYLDVGPEPILALFHDADGGAAVLMCPPFGWDDVASYPVRRQWAERLAAAGHPTLRFDLPGTGDSAGSPTDPGRVDAWVGAVAGAAAWLRTHTGRRVVGIGIGPGGLLLWRAAADGAPIDDLVLWGTPARGRALVRELRAFARIETQIIVDAGAPEPPPLPDGAIAPGGFLVSAETAAALAELDVTAPALPERAGRRALLLDRDGIEVPEELRTVLAEAGVDVAAAPGAGYGEMLAEPHEARLPLAVFGEVDEWLAAASADAADAPAEAPAELATLELPEVRELPLSVEQPRGRLFGILAEPRNGARSDLCAVLLNAGAVRRIGPNRMWVDTARRWAAAGVPTLRLDLEAIGDSEGDPAPYSYVGELYTPTLVGQVRRALDALEERGLPRRFVLVGLCSGAYWAFHAALEDERVRAAFLVNSRALHWDPELDASRDVRRIRRQLLRRSSWRRVRRGTIPMSASRVLSIARFLAATPLRARRRTARVKDVARLLDRLRDRGARAVFAFCDGEPLRDELDAIGAFEQRERWPNVELRPIPGRDHTLRPLWMHPPTHELLDRALEDELERAGGGSRATAGARNASKREGVTG